MDRVLLAIVIGLQFSLGVYLAWKLNIWEDEAFSLETTRHGLAAAVARARSFELQPPLYFGLLSLWRSVDDGVLWARLLSIAVMIGATASMVPLARAYVPSISPAVVAFAFAINPIAIWAATEIRPYALTILLACLLLITFYRAYLGAATKARWRILHAALAVLALYTQYYLGFLLLAQGIVVVLQGNWRALGRLAVAMIGVAFIASPVLWAALDKTEAHRPRQVEHTDVVEAAAFSYRRLRDYVLPHTSPHQIQALRSLDRCESCPPVAAAGERARKVQLSVALLLAGVSIIVVAVAVPRGGVRHHHVAVWGMLVVLAACYAMISKFLGVEVVAPRHLAGALPLAVLAPFSVLDALGKAWLAKAWVGVLVAFALPTGLSQYYALAKPGDYARVAELIARSESPDTPVLTFHCTIAMPLSYYYTGKGGLFSVPRSFNLVRLEYEGCALQSRNDVEEVLRRAETWQTLWLVDSGSPGYLGIDYHREHLDQVITSCFDTVRKSRLYDVSVTLLKSNGRCPER